MSSLYAFQMEEHRLGARANFIGKLAFLVLLGAGLGLGVDFTYSCLFSKMTYIYSPCADLHFARRGSRELFTLHSGYEYNIKTQKLSIFKGNLPSPEQQRRSLLCLPFTVFVRTDMGAIKCELFR